MKTLIIALLLLFVSSVSFAQGRGRGHAYGHRGHYVVHQRYYHSYGRPHYVYHRYYGHPRYHYYNYRHHRHYSSGARVVIHI